MAIYSCNLKSVGKTTQAPGTAGAHLSYIGRAGADPALDAYGMPATPRQASQWMNDQEGHDRRNARVIDKIMVALPVELNVEERQALVRDYVRELTQDKVPWYFAIHQKGEDAHNPHAHIVIRDRDLESGKRVLGFSDSARDWQKKKRPQATPTDYVRERWEVICNRHLERAGHEARIDRRNLKAQEIDRLPTVHIGPQAHAIEAAGKRPISQERVETTWRKCYRATIPYPNIDQGFTRREYCTAIITLNQQLQPSNDNHARDIFMQPIDDKKLADQLERQEQLAEKLEIADKRFELFKAAQALQAAEARADEDDRKRRQDQERGDITDAQNRYGQALGKHYDIRDPYASLARAAMEEYRTLLQGRAELAKQIAQEKDPDKRKSLELRRDIEGMDYMAITERRIAGQMEIASGRDTESVRASHDKADHYMRQAADLRQEYRALQRQQERPQDDKAERQPEQPQRDKAGEAITAPPDREKRERIIDAWKAQRVTERQEREPERQPHGKENQQQDQPDNADKQVAPKTRDEQEQAKRERMGAAWEVQRGKEREEQALNRDGPNLER